MSTSNKKILNIYSISFTVDGIEYGGYLKAVRITKDVTQKHFIDNVFVFDKAAIDLLNMLLSKATVSISLNSGDNYNNIYKVTGLISKVSYKDEKVFVFFNTDIKLNWIKKNGISLTTEMKTLHESVEEFAKKLNSYYKSKYDTKVFYNTKANLNNYKYEALLFPIKKSNFDTLYQMCKNYYIMNVPFYIVLDDFNFSKSIEPIMLSFYDLSNVKSLRATNIEDLNTSTVPEIVESNTYYDVNTYYNVGKMQKFNNSIYNYSYLKPKTSLDSSNRFNYNNVPDSESLAANRQNESKTFFSKAAKYYTYKVQDIDLTKFVIGTRFVNNTSNVKMQYDRAIVEAEIVFTAIGKHNVVSQKDKINNEFMTLVKFSAISN